MTDMTVQLCKPSKAAVPIHLIDTASFAKHSAKLPAAARRWLATLGFDGKPDTHALLADARGRLEAVWAGVPGAQHPFVLSALPRSLPPGRYKLGDAGLPADDEAAALSWELGAYVFDLYKPVPREAAELMLPPSAGATRGCLLAAATVATRDLVNTPAEHMGPAELAEAARLLAEQYGATFEQTVGDALLKAGFPAIHTVGRASTRAPRLIELNWGRPRDPKVTLVGKGVCFDSGGVNIKGADGMRLMKKDMGGAANVLGLATLVMALKLPLRLQVLIPAVDNAIAGNAYRPGDVIKTRSGLHIEIGNTDAEGRVILCDALAYGVEGQPDLMIDMATLTGAARIALGHQLPALFCRRMDQARELVDRGLALHDPLWHLPLWAGYHPAIESDVADIVNTGRNAMGGAINAANFLADFVPAATEWLHIDLAAWNDTARPGRPVGGEAQGVRTLLAYLQTRFSKA